MKFLTKSLLSAGAAAAALVSVATPVQARDGDGISAGEVIAGALIIGGIAAVLSGGDKDRDRNYDNRDYRYDNSDSRYGYNNNYGRYGHRGRHGGGYGYGYQNHSGSRNAVNMCVNAVERWANRYSRSDVTEIRNIDRTPYGYRVTGKLVVQDGWRGNDRGYGYNRYDRDKRYGRGHGYDRGYDRGRFTCYVERGRVIDVNYSGLDQWR
jgi:hypothetical protein